MESRPFFSLFSNCLNNESLPFFVDYYYKNEFRDLWWYYVDCWAYLVLSASWQFHFFSFNFLEFWFSCVCLETVWGFWEMMPKDSKQRRQLCWIIFCTSVWSQNLHVYYLLFYLSLLPCLAFKTNTVFGFS